MVAVQGVGLMLVILVMHLIAHVGLTVGRGAAATQVAATADVVDVAVDVEAIDAE